MALHPDGDRLILLVYFGARGEDEARVRADMRAALRTLRVDLTGRVRRIRFPRGSDAWGRWARDREATFDRGACIASLAVRCYPPG